MWSRSLLALTIGASAFGEFRDWLLSTLGSWSFWAKIRSQIRRPEKTSFSLWAFLDCEDGWSPIQFGNREFCSKFLGVLRIQDAAQNCADLGAKLPLPENEEEFAALRDGLRLFGGTFILDATDMDLDGIWVDSSGNVVNYLAPLWYYPDPSRPKQAWWFFSIKLQFFLGLKHLFSWKITYKVFDNWKFSVSEPETRGRIRLQSYASIRSGSY